MIEKIMKNRKTIIGVLLVVVLLFVVFKAGSVVRKKEDDNLKYNNNKSFIKTKTVKGIIFKDVSCVYDGKNSVISYKIVNSTKKKIHLKNYDVYVRDKKKKLLTKIVVKYDQVLDVGKKYDMANQVVGVDLTDSYYMDLKLKVEDKD